MIGTEMKTSRYLLSARLAVVLLIGGYALSACAQLGGNAGTFTNMGYGARGISMGNSGTALTTGNVQALYNPALGAFEENRNLYVSYSVLGLDRTYNIVSFTAPIPVYKKNAGDSTHVRVSTIGVSVGLVNTGVSNIDSRDADGEQIGILSTYQNFYYGSVSIRFRPEFSVGVMVKFLDAKLYDNIKSGGVGLDVGGVYQINDALSVAAVIQNLFAKYTWDSTPLYNESGQVVTDPFPVFFHAGAAYHVPGSGATVTADIEQSNVSTTITRIGGEYAFNDWFALRAGIDGYDVVNRLSDQVHPSFGLTVTQNIGSFIPSFEYAAYFEPVAGGLTHVLSLGFQF